MAFINDIIYVIRNGIFPSNTYLLNDGVSKDCIVFDPGLDSNKIEEEIEVSGWKPIAIICTHGHFDHIASASTLKKKYDIPFYLHKGDFKISQSANFYLKIAKIETLIDTIKPDFLFEGQSGIINIGNFEISYQNFPGHTNGSCVFKYKKFLFSGDILFEHGIGDDSIPKADISLLSKSLDSLLSQYESEDLLLPGHGNDARLGHIKQNNIILKLFLSKTTQTNA